VHIACAALEPTDSPSRILSATARSGRNHRFGTNQRLSVILAWSRFAFIGYSL
jgi:hypothetical protein